MRRIDATAKAYLALGITKGDHVTICMPNCPQAVDSFYALNRIGAVSNMIHPLSAAGEIRHYLDFSHSKAILTLDQFYTKVASILPELKAPCKLLLARIQDELPLAMAVGYELTKARKYPAPPRKGDYIWWNEFMRMGKSVIFRCPDACLPQTPARPSSTPAERPAPPRASCSATSTSTPSAFRPSPHRALRPSTA